MNIGHTYGEQTGYSLLQSMKQSSFLSKSLHRPVNDGIFQLAAGTSSNVILSIGHYNSAVNYSSTSSTVAHMLTVGEKVWIHFQCDTGSTKRLDEHANYSSNKFSGTLVHKTLN